jgi:hypothetical protein
VQEAELLFTIAEIAVAFAGFASIVSVLGRRYSKDDPRLDSFRIRTMLQASLGAVFSSLFPFLPANFGVSDPLVWRISALVGVVAFGILGAEWWLRYRELNRQGLRESAFIPYIFTALELGVFIPLILVIFGSFPQLAFRFYLAALYLLLLESGVFFFRVVTSLLVAKE